MINYGVLCWSVFLELAVRVGKEPSDVADHGSDAGYVFEETSSLREECGKEDDGMWGFVSEVECCSDEGESRDKGEDKEGKGGGAQSGQSECDGGRGGV